MTPRRTRTPALDNLCTSATELAFQAARELGGDEVGEYQGCEAEGDRVVTHYFASLVPGYVGWRWAVTVARASRQRVATVDEVVMLPGADALLAPPWVPWSERLRPGDLGVGDILPAAPDDDRLVPAYADSGDPEIEAARWELGFGRPRVMSRFGRQDAAERWYHGETGPDTPMARNAPGRCGTCGFYLPLAGALSAMFGACGNEYAPADGRVVAADHGCGAHSEASVASGLGEPPSAVVYDDSMVESVSAEETGPSAEPVPAGEPLPSPEVLSTGAAVATDPAGPTGKSPETAAAGEAGTGGRPRRRRRG